MLRTRTVLVLFLMTCFANFAHAQQEKGDIELQFQGSFSTLVGGDVTSTVGTIAGKIGPFITANIQVGVGPTLTISTSSSTSGGVTTTSTTATFGTTAFVVYSLLLKDAKVVPYLGASYYKKDFSNSNDNGWLGANGGAKFFFAKRTAVDFSANYLFSLNETTKGQQLLFAFGLSFLL
jgi:hypothetical protein